MRCWNSPRFPSRLISQPATIAAGSIRRRVSSSREELPTDVSQARRRRRTATLIDRVLNLFGEVSMAASPIDKALNAVRILIVDDDRLNRSLLKAIFEAEGCRVTLADGGTAGLEAFNAESIDVVLLDLRMPGLDGV